jgi:ABC-type polysaccharide/polyol phosphate export permease
METAFWKHTDVDMSPSALVKSLSDFVLTMVRRRFLIFEMASRELASQHVATSLGLFWTIVNPIITIFIFYLVFEVGFRVAPAKNVPFVVWLTAGLAAWGLFSDVIAGATRSVTSNPHLVKKVVFPLSILPVVKLLASLLTHVVLLAILAVLMVLYHLPPTLLCIQIVYYFLAMTVLVLGISWITATVNVFFKDTAQIVGVLLQFGLWGTPILWEVSMMPERLQTAFKLNPMYYIVQGYRESVLYGVPFWHHPALTVYFWVVALTLFVLGAVFFRFLKPHFADVV